jgi:hypothetical protein
MVKVYIVTEHVDYEGDVGRKVFSSYEKAVAYADELTTELVKDGLSSFMSVNVETHEVVE